MSEFNEESSAKKRGVSRRKFIASATGTAAAALLRVPASGQTPTQNNVQYRIHPAIGIARLGNADPGTYFIGPEAPGFGPLGDAPGSAPTPKKVNGLIKPQGARFRIWEYQMDENGLWQPIQEVNLSTQGVVNIQWTVHLANKKASFHQFNGTAGEATPPLPLRNASVTNRASLEIDFGAQSIQGAAQGPVVFGPNGSAGQTYPTKPNGSPVIGTLGQLRTDSAGRLIVIGGQGAAGYNTATEPALATYANNDNWFDDASDGPVSATITLNGGTTITALGAWVLCEPPDFAPPISNSVSLYDLLLDLAVRELAIPANNGLYATGGPLARIAQLKANYTPGAGPEFPGIIPDFDSEIKPTLVNGYNYYFVDDLVPFQHTTLIDPNNGNTNPAYNEQREFIAGYVRPPEGVTGLAGKQSMPHLLGDYPYTPSASQAQKFLALTHTQYGLLYNWATGPFLAAGSDPAPTATITPWGLDRAALENCVGGAFFPGIEVGWEIRAPGLYMEPFRINPNATSQYYGETGVPIGPGYFSRQQAVPWHADFNDCRNENNDGWWPGQRPNSVYVESTGDRIEWARPDTKWSDGSISSHQDMLNNWYKFGFIAWDGTAFVETERNSGIQ